mmetsp:Transcript_23503/g.58361  ORF Transcript_23503/g.58361 Transcript_23503/m.58361 type:complete len:499 (+) Transcript_23503:1-1497(+)
MQRLAGMAEGMGDVEVIVDVRDARMPETGTHPLFQKWVDGMRVPRMVVYTHEDLLTDAQIEEVRRWTVAKLGTEEELVFFQDLREYKAQRAGDLKHIQAKITEICTKKPMRSNLEIRKALVVGVPNVGKSSFIYINTSHMTKVMKNKGMYHAPKVVNRPGETKSIKSHWMRVKPNVMLVDTPGMFPPQWFLNEDPERIYKLALTNAIVSTTKSSKNLDNIHTVPIEVVADYLLYKLNKASLFDYVKLYKLSGPTNDLKTVLNAIPLSISSKLSPVATFLDAWHSGALGSLILDDLKHSSLGKPNFDRTSSESTKLLKSILGEPRAGASNRESSVPDIGSVDSINMRSYQKSPVGRPESREDRVRAAYSVRRNEPPNAETPKEAVDYRWAESEDSRPGSASSIRSEPSLFSFGFDETTKSSTEVTLNTESDLTKVTARDSTLSPRTKSENIESLRNRPSSVKKPASAKADLPCVPGIDMSLLEEEFRSIERAFAARNRK